MRNTVHLGISIWLFTTAAGGCASTDSLEPVYEGCATDENWRTFDDYITTQRITFDPANNPQVLSPMDGYTAPSSAPATFTWQPTATNAGTASGNVSCAKYQPQSLGFHPLHEPPVSGTVYDLHLAVGGRDVYRVLTTRQRAAISPSAWQSLAGQHVKVALYSAQLLQNDVTQGPFMAKPFEIFVTP